MIKVLYFAGLRDRIGASDEEMALPGNATINGVIEILKARGDAWADAFGGKTRVLAAVNQEMARPEENIKDGDEVAFFPPVTGG